MKKTFLALITAGFMASCSNNVQDTPAADSTVTVAPAPAIEMPYTAAYSSDFSMGKPELTKLVLDMYKAVEENRMDDLGQYYADSVIRHNFAQKEIKLTRDEMIKLSKEFRAQFKEFLKHPWRSLPYTPTTGTKIG